MKRLSIPSSWYFHLNRRRTIRKLQKRLKNDEEVRLHTFISREIYENYGNKEQINFELGGERYTTKDGKMSYVSFQDIRAGYLTPIVSKIEEKLKTVKSDGGKLSVLEVGCGNCVNLVQLSSKFSSSDVKFYGIDISPKRLEVSKFYWKERLNEVELSVDNATKLSNFGDNSFDIVFTMHCLEQIPYRVAQAITSIARVAPKTVIFVEPVFEFANQTQKLYSICADQLRTLIPEIEAAGFDIVECYPIELLANPMNQTGVVVVDVTSSCSVN